MGVLAAALQKHGEHTFVRLLAILAYKEARQEAENARLRWREASREACTKLGQKALTGKVDILSCLTNRRILFAVLGQRFLGCSDGNQN